MSIQRLTVFLSAAEHLNFTKAAKEQCISQTAVSQQIKLLEEERGFSDGGWGVVLPSVQDINESILQRYFKGAADFSG